MSKITGTQPSCAEGSIAVKSQQHQKPYSVFDRRQKVLIIFIVSTAATFSGFASNIYFPALPTIAQDLSVSTELVNLTVTVYLIFQGLAPSLWGPLSDAKGRRSAYICTFLVFLVACIGLGLTKNYTTLIVLRCLQSTGSASTIAIGSGVIGDITTRAERGGFMGIFQAGLLAPVAVGPIIGGALAGSLGWRTIFWFLAIYGGIFLLLLILLLPETLQSLVGNGSRISSNAIVKYPLSMYQRLTRVKWIPETSPPNSSRRPIDITGPIRILVRKEAAPIIIFLAIYYTVWQMTITAMSVLFKDRYDLNETQLGLTYIANGIGSMIGTLTTGRILDLQYRQVQSQVENTIISQSLESGKPNIHIIADSPAAQDQGQNQNEDDEIPLERARLRIIPLFSLTQCLSILLFGWTVQYAPRVPIAIPILSTFISGWTAVSTQSIVMTYLVDVFSDRSAAASASLNLARCLIAAAGTSVVMPMIEKLGVGVAFTVCVAVQAVAVLGFVVQWRCGRVWRREARLRAASGG